MLLPAGGYCNGADGGVASRRNPAHIGDHLKWGALNCGALGCSIQPCLLLSPGCLGLPALMAVQWPAPSLQSGGKSLHLGLFQSNWQAVQLSCLGQLYHLVADGHIGQQLYGSSCGAGAHLPALLLSPPALSILVIFGACLPIQSSILQVQVCTCLLCCPVEVQQWQCHFLP